jgi:hypothetical protein
VQQSWKVHLIPIVEECLYEKSLFSSKGNDCPIRALVCRQHRGRHRLFAGNRFSKHFRVVSVSKSASASPPWLARHLFRSSTCIPDFPGLKTFMHTLKFMHYQRYGMTGI